jgi:cytosine/adenosine deaminase-related metal-dependent hydrolase
MTRMLVRCGWVVSMDEEVGDLTDAEILIEDDEIAAIGKNLGAASDETVDASDMIVMPGLVNAHMHTWEYGLRGFGAAWLSADYHKNIHGNMATRYQPEDNYVANLVGALDQINNGVTTLFDWCHNLRNLEMAERSVDALEESGIRAVFGHGTAKPPQRPGDRHYSEVPHPRERIEALRKGRFASDDRLVRLAIAMLGPDQSTAEVMLHDYRLAREFGLLSTAHSFAPPERRLIPDGLRLLAEHGLLGPDHNICHGNYFSDQELKTAIDAGVSVTPTVLVETRGKAPRPLTGRARALGALPSLGIDTPPMVSADMFDETRMAFHDLRRTLFLDNEAAGGEQFTQAPLGAREALRWATLGGARALMLEDKIGSLKPGKKADMIFLRAGDLNLHPIHDPVAAIVNLASGRNVDAVIIDGAFRKRNGKLLFPERVLAKRQSELAESANRIIREAGLALAA